MQAKVSITTVSLVLLFASSANANPGCVVFSSQAMGMNGNLVSLQVGQGHGLNANFIPTKETIKKVWIDDSSQIGVSFDGELCQWTSEKQAECSDAGATVIHLRQTKPINFPDLPRSPSGSTLLTAITEGESGRKLYQFSVTPVKSVPPCSSLTIMPDPQRLEPLLPSVSQNHQPNNQPNQPWQQPSSIVPQTAPGVSNGASNDDQAFTRANPANKQPRSDQAPNFTSSNSSSALTTISDATAAKRGLEIATKNGQLQPNTTEWKKMQSAITLLQGGVSLNDAASRADVPISLLTQLISWGQQQ